jgi:hypothetical protein
MHRIEGPIRKGTHLVRLSAALYCELAVSALQLLPIRRVKTLLQAPRARSTRQAWV